MQQNVENNTSINVLHWSKSTKDLPVQTELMSQLSRSPVLVLAPPAEPRLEPEQTQDRLSTGVLWEYSVMAETARGCSGLVRSHTTISPLKLPVFTSKIKWQ